MSEAAKIRFANESDRHQLAAMRALAQLISYELPVKIVVLDNHRLGIVSQFQRLNWGRDPTCGDKWNPDFAAIARAYGLLAETVSDGRRLEAALARALAAPDLMPPGQRRPSDKQRRRFAPGPR